MQSRTKPAFTLVELMVSVAIIGILTAIIFVSFRNDQKRNDAKRAAEQLQVDIQDIQIMAQSGRVLNQTKLCFGGLNDGGACTDSTQCPAPVATTATCISRAPLRYGVYITKNATNYRTYADIFGGVNYVLDTPPDVVLLTRSFQSHLKIVDIQAYGTNVPIGYVPFGVDISFDSPTAAVTLRGRPSAVLADNVVLTVQQTQAKICYSITVDRLTGTVSRRQLASSACP